MTAASKRVDLLEKQRPRQERAKRTYESILNSAAELLMEVGVERISTNLIAERAGVTVPALYRYFPNKYAVIHALGQNLMERQTVAVQGWLETGLDGNAALDPAQAAYEVLRRIYNVIRTETAGIEIFHALRVLGPLRDLRLASRRRSAENLAGFIASALGRPVDTDLRMYSRMTVELSCGIVEMALEEQSLSAEKVLRQGALMLEAYWSRSLRRSA